MPKRNPRPGYIIPPAVITRKRRVHYGTVGCKVLYNWNGRPTFWGARAGSVKARAERLADDSRATDIRISIGGLVYAVEDVEVYR